MASFVGIANRVYLAHLDMSGKAHTVNFGDVTRDMQNFTTFNDGGFTCIQPGLISATGTVEGFQDYATDALDDEISVAQLGIQYPFSVVPATGTAAVGDKLWFSRGILAKLNPLDGAKGDAAKMMMDLAYDTAILPGYLGHAATAVTTSASDSGVVLTGPTASQKLYGALHVFSFTSLTSASIIIESDDNAGFTSATSRITFSDVTATTSEFKSVAGSFSSETRHRVRYTLVGSGSITFAVAFGVT